MGVNIPNIDFIIHWGLPSSSLSYWQETGRCSRDGREGYAVCYAYQRSITKCEDQVLKSCPEGGKCLRLTILSCFFLKGMKKDQLDVLKSKSECDQLCENICRCQFCSCCCVCWKICRCKAKSNNLMLIFHLMSEESQLYYVVENKPQKPCKLMPTNIMHPHYAEHNSFWLLLTPKSFSSSSAEGINFSIGRCSTTSGEGYAKMAGMFPTVEIAETAGLYLRPKSFPQ
ncbi:hypothetical protein KUTeg_001264 [Tegillarca granosa]|uniref:DNA 3'-5' helicase n=1 Tax=Tegillarca granosa TaxID=220873 RepID=A0ABQ9FV56_TEGGR|nr:hypothetical protein KUTeg_001264 [Tegillarca granosa]